VTHNIAKFLALAVGAIGLSALPALADSPCPTDPLSTYLTSYSAGSGVGCTVSFGGVTLDFSKFFYTPGGTTMAPASSIGVSPAPPPNGDGPGLNFNPAASISSGTEDIEVGFTVTALAGAQINDIFIALNAPLALGTGTINYQETFCGGPQNKCTIFVEAPVTNDTNVINLATTDLGGPVTSLSITKDVLLSAGSNGSATLTGFQNEYSTVSTPEPRAISLLLGLGLLAGFAIFKRRQATQS
jgi:hypothetical protein